jgi:Flp pilus assembly protein TadB
MTPLIPDHVTAFQILKDHPLTGKVGETVTLTEILTRAAAQEVGHEKTHASLVRAFVFTLAGTIAYLIGTADFLPPLGVIALAFIAFHVLYHLVLAYRSYRHRPNRDSAHVTVKALWDNGYIQPVP